MIKDNLKNSSIYYGISEDIKTALINASELNENSPLGRVELSEKVYYTVMEYYGKEEDCDAEAHNNYADIQIILSGNEKIGYAPKKNLNSKVSYDPFKDIEILKGKYDFIDMEKGDFMILFPDDGHAPSVKTNDKLIKKAVFKIKLT